MYITCSTGCSYCVLWIISPGGPGAYFQKVAVHGGLIIIIMGGYKQNEVANFEMEELIFTRGLLLSRE